MSQPTTSAARNLSLQLAAVAPRALFAVPLAPEARLDLLRGMLCRLEDATSAGQHYLMDKVLPLLRREALDPNKRFRSSDLDVINRSLADLEHEASRMAPDPSSFGHKAQILVDVFAIA
jgi:hypothetical protein